jgi:hypothetical protein
MLQPVPRCSSAGAGVQDHRVGPPRVAGDNLAELVGDERRVRGDVDDPAEVLPRSQQ